MTDLNGNIFNLIDNANDYCEPTYLGVNDEENMFQKLDLKAVFQKFGINGKNTYQLNVILNDIEFGGTSFYYSDDRKLYRD